jgi:hypothetical protein
MPQQHEILDRLASGRITNLEVWLGDKWPGRGVNAGVRLLAEQRTFTD